MENYTANIPALDPLASGVNDSPAPPVLAGLPLNVEDISAAQNQYRNRKHFHKVNYATQDEVSAAKMRHIQVEMEHATVGAIGPAWAAGLQAALDNLTQVTNDPNTGLQALAGTVQALAGTVNDPNTGLQALARTVNDPNTGLQALARTVNDPNTGLQALARTVNDRNTGLQALAGTVQGLAGTVQALAGTVINNAVLLGTVDVTVKQEYIRNMNRSTVRTIDDRIYPIYHPNGHPAWNPESCSEVLYCSEDEADYFIRYYNIVPPDVPTTLEDKRKFIRAFLGVPI